VLRLLFSDVIYLIVDRLLSQAAALIADVLRV
jgi:hypothetical protein